MYDKYAETQIINDNMELILADKENKCYVNKHASYYTVKMFPHNRKVCRTLHNLYIVLLAWNVRPDQIVENTVS